MSYDLYVELGGESQQDVDALVKGNGRAAALDIAARIRLLAGIAARNENVKDYAVSGERRQGGGYKSLVHTSDPQQTSYAKQIAATLKTFDLLKPSVPALATFPFGSWFLQFTFTLAKPWISKDDDPFYVAESVNPVRKDKVFQVPVMSAASWKGLLRWMMMQVRLFETRNDENWSDEQWAEERFAQWFLFGDEKGEEPSGAKDFAAYLDARRQNAARLYQNKVRACFELEERDELPHHSGRLMFYPTFFDLIDVEVINPHSRKTKAGTHPIYLECVPAGAHGTFSLLYVPFDLIGAAVDETRAQAAQDLATTCEAIEAMMLTYGFSAKRTSGYGAAKDEITGVLKTTWANDCAFGKKTFAQLADIVAEVTNG